MEKMPSPPRPRNHWSFLRIVLVGSLVVALQLTVAARKKPVAQTESEAADAFQRKIDYIQANAKKDPPDGRPTVVQENEVNAYFAQRRLKMPDGVKQVMFQFQPGKLTAHTRIDFEEIMKERHSWNPLLALFSGVHDADVVAYAQGLGGRVQVRVDSVALDGVKVPRMALEMFIEKFVQPKYPAVRLDGDYKLPARLDTVKIAEHQATVTQR